MFPASLLDLFTAECPYSHSFIPQPILSLYDTFLSKQSATFVLCKKKGERQRKIKKKSEKERQTKKNEISTKGCLTLLRIACVFVCIVRPTSRERGEKAEIVKRKFGSEHIHRLYPESVLKWPVTLYYTTHAGYANPIKVKCPIAIMSFIKFPPWSLFIYVFYFYFVGARQMSNIIYSII